MTKGENQKKVCYIEKTQALFREYRRIFLVNVDNVASSQMQQIRASLRGHAVVLMGKNTMVRKAMRDIVSEVPELEQLVSYIRGNIGLVFTNADLKTVRDILVSNRVKAAAKVGLVAQADITIPAGNTGMDPNKTSFFQALGISTKVVKGAIEIINEQVVVKAGQKVGPSEAALFNMLNLTPFTFGMTVETVYDNGCIFDAAMLDITDEAVAKMVRGAATTMAALSFAINRPTVASAPHMLLNAFKSLLGVSLSSDNISFPAVDKIRARLAAGPAVAAAVASAAPAAAAAAAAVEEPEEEEEMGLDLFG